MPDHQLVPRQFVIDRMIDAMGAALQHVAQEVGTVQPNEIASAVLCVAQRTSRVMCRQGETALDRMSNQQAVLAAIDYLKFAAVDVDTTGVH